jgi:hypothetical protein
MMRGLFPTEIADMPPWMSSLAWQTQQWVLYGGIWYQYKRKDNEWWSRKDEHSDEQKLQCPPPWWEIAAYWASVHEVPVSDLDLVDTPNGLVWHDRVNKRLDQELWNKLRRLHKWLGGGYYPSYATEQERKQVVWFKLRSPWTWVMFDESQDAWVEGPDKRLCPRPTELDIFYATADAAAVRPLLEANLPIPAEIPIHPDVAGLPLQTAEAARGGYG